MATHAEVEVMVIDWIKQRNLREVDFFDDPHLGGYPNRLRPDFLIKPKYARKRMVALEVEGSNSSIDHVLGQIILYKLTYSAVILAIPKAGVAKLKKIRAKLKRKASSFFDFKILSCSQEGSRLL